MFDYVSELAHTPEWNWAIAETVKPNPGPIGEGTTYQQTSRVPEQTTENLRISVLEPPKRLQVEGTLARHPARLSYQFSPYEDGTRLTNQVELKPQGVARLLSPVLTGRIEAAVADNLSHLKHHLEGTR